MVEHLARTIYAPDREYTQDIRGVTMLWVSPEVLAPIRDADDKLHDAPGTIDCPSIPGVAAPSYLVPLLVELKEHEGQLVDTEDGEVVVGRGPSYTIFSYTGEVPTRDGKTRRAAFVKDSEAMRRGVEGFFQQDPTTMRRARIFLTEEHYGNF